MLSVTINKSALAARKNLANAEILVRSEECQSAASQRNVTPITRLEFDSAASPFTIVSSRWLAGWLCVSLLRVIHHENSHLARWMLLWQSYLRQRPEICFFRRFPPSSSFPLEMGVQPAVEWEHTLHTLLDSVCSISSSGSCWFNRNLEQLRALEVFTYLPEGN